MEVVPGVTAALAASADLAISLTRRGAARSVTFVTPRVGHGEKESSWIAAVLAADTAAIYMGAGEASAISEALIKAGKAGNTPVALVENASLAESNCVHGVLEDLPQLAASLGSGPVVILLGEVIRGQGRNYSELRTLLPNNYDPDPELPESLRSRKSAIQA